MTAATDTSAAAGAAAADPAPRADLQFQLDAALPREIATGAPTALFVCGWCFCPAAPIRALRILVDGRPEPVGAHGMPRLDVLHALHPGIDPYDTAAMDADPRSAEDPRLLSYRSGFWGLAPIPAGGEGAIELALEAELDGGGVATAALGSVARARLPEPVDGAAPAEPGAGPLVAICMATHEPPAGMLERQIESIRAQTHRNWVCVISDDSSSPERFAALEAAVAGDRRFVVSRSPERLGFYRNFERALALAPREAEFVAMADQDDRWYEDKLTALLGAIGDAQLVYSDQRIVSESGELLADSYWETRANNHSDLLSLLVANSVTGAASLLRRELLDDALPFPPPQFAHFHDHWIALVALSLGEIAFVDRPLYDYVQHGDASLGHAAATRMVGLRQRLGSLRRDPRERVRLWRMHYFVDIARLMQFATVLLMRCGARMAPAKRAVLERFLGAERSLRALGSLWLRGARELVGGRPETLGAEWMLAQALAWRRLLGATATRRPRRLLRLDSLPPADLAPRPGHEGPGSPAVRAISAKIEPLKLAVREGAPPRVNLLIPSFDLEHFFGGYIAKLNLARRLALRGARVRVVTVDPQPPLPSSWQRRLESYEGLDGLFERVEIAFGRESQGLEVSRSDRFVASTWWSAHVAAAAVRSLDAPRFLYLIQEYEPFTFPMGAYAALADESYRFDHVALFSTELLRDFFRRRGIGVYRGGERAGDRDSVAFQNAITAVAPPAAHELAARSVRRLLFYARPEDHAARNMFELGVLALGRAAQRGALRGWELHGIGTLGAERHMELGAGATLALLPRSGQGEYAQLLRGHDVGLALMYTPHPSLVPIEMAAAGMLTVTNSFENKTAEALAGISPNLIAAEPGVEPLAEAIAAATAAAGDVERRVSGAAVRWSRDWDSAFDDRLLDRVDELLGL